MFLNLVSYCFFLKVLGISHSKFDEKLEKMKSRKGLKLDSELTASDLKELVEEYKNVYIEAIGEEFPSGTSLLW